MQSFETTVEGDQIHIEGFPQAERLVRISGELAHRLADLSLHRDDLTFAKGCLEALPRQDQDGSDADFVLNALYRTAIVHLFKCFGNSKSRSSIDPQEIYASEGPVALEVFEYFKVIRNKHLVHDENAYTQGHPGAVINKAGAERNVQLVVSLNVAVQIVNQESFGNLNLLVTTALNWVAAAYDELAERIRADLEKLPRAELLAMPDLKILPITEEQARGRRIR